MRSFPHKKPIFYFPLQTTSLSIFTGIIVSLFIFIVLWQSETNWINTEFYSYADEMAEVTTKTIEVTIHDHDKLAAFMMNSEHVSRTEFQNFLALEMTGRQRPITDRSIFWVPYVPADARSSFEMSAANEGLSGFKISERSPEGEMVQASARERYYPVFYAVSFGEADYFLPGFDLGSEPVWRTALEKAQLRDSLIVVDTAGTLAEKPEHERIATIWPVYRFTSSQAQTGDKGSLLGFVVSIQNFNDVIRTAISPFSQRGFATYLYNLNLPAERQLVLSLTPDGSPIAGSEVFPAFLETDISHKTNISLGDQNYHLVIRPKAGWVASQRSLVPWLTLFMGLFITFGFASRQYYIRQVSQMERENRTRVDLAMENASIGYWDYDPTTQEMVSCTGFETIIRLPKGSIHCFEDLLRYTYPDDAAKISQAISTVIRGESVPALNVRVIRSDGALRWVTISGYVQKGEQGQVAHVVGVVQDITISKQIEEKIRISEDRYRRLVELSPDVILIEVNERLAFINKAGLSLLGAAHLEDVIGRPVLDFLPAEFQQSAREWIAQVNVGEASGRQFESKIINLHGKAFDVEVAASQFFYMDQLGGLFLLRDITERKHAEAAIRFQAELLSSVQDAIISVDENRAITSWNSGAETIYGWKSEEAIGKRLDEILKTEYLEISYDQALQEVTGCGNFRGIVQQRRKDGSTVTIDSSVRTLFDPQGSVIGYLGVNRDITERRKAETELHEQKEILQKIFDHIPLMIDLINDDGKIKFVNREWEKTMGWTLEEIRRQNLNVFAELYPEEKDYNRLVQFLSTKQMEWTDFKTRVRDGRVIDTSWMEVKLSDGTIIGLGQDVTERKRAKDDLMKAEENLRLAVRAANICFWDWNLETGHVYYSPEWRALLGYSEDEVADDIDAWKSNLHPDDFTSTIETLEAFLANPWPNVEMVFRLRHKDGTYRSVLAQASIYCNEAGVPTRLMGLSVDITRRKQVEEALRQSEERFRLLAENAHDIIYRFEMVPDRKFTYISPAVTGITGYTPAEIYADPRLLSSMLGEKIWNNLTACRRIKKASKQPTIIRVQKKDGQAGWIELSNVPIFDPGGSLIALEGIARDITERQETERNEKIQSSVTRIFASTVKSGDALHQVMQLIATELNWEVAELWWLESNESYLTLKSEWHESSQDLDDFAEASHAMKFALGEGIQGYTWREACSQWIVDGFENAYGMKTEQSAHLASAGLHTGIATPVIENDEVLGVITFFSRSVQPYNQHTTALLDDIGHQIGHFIARKQAEYSLAQAELMYRMMFEEAPIMYAIIRDKGNGPEIHDCNQLFQKSLGYKRKELIGKLLGECMTPDSREKMLKGFFLNVTTGQNISQDRELLTKDGRIILTMLHAVPEFDHSGKILGTRCMYVDITERKSMEQALEAERSMLAVRVEERTAELSLLNSQLRRANRAKDEFLANMSHELRTPLNGILAFTEALIDQTRGPLNERQLKAMRSIDSSGRHLLSLINDVLDLSKIEAGKLDIQIEKVSIDDVCRASLIFIKETASKKQIKVQYQNNVTGLCINADPRRLKQILVNLLSNAVKFTPAGGNVYLGVEGNLADEILNITICDTGIGISKEDQKCLFQPFTQIDSSLTRNQEGSGLGLVLVHRLVDMHGGGIQLDSEPGKGSCFTVSLPFNYNKAGLSRNERFEGDPVSDLNTYKGRKRVLFVEDNEISIEAIGEYLTDVGYKVYIARNGKEAVDRVHEWKPEIILMDIQMPVMNGLEAIQRIRADQQYTKVPIIALTALAMAGDREYCLQNGATEYMSKPVSLKNLVQMIEQLTSFTNDTL